jgi:hypothetical protein
MRAAVVVLLALLYHAGVSAMHFHPRGNISQVAQVDDGAIEIRERQVHECRDPSIVGTNVFVMGKILTYREEKDAGAEIVVIASSSGLIHAWEST